MRSRRIGDVSVGPVALGAAVMTLTPGRDRQARATVQAALESGVTLIDTADTYAPRFDAIGYGERLVARILRELGRPDVLVATKFGHIRTSSGDWLLDGRPEAVRAACERSLRALGVAAIDLYQYHRPDPRVPYAETMGALAELRDAGKARMIGVCNASVAQIEIAARELGPGGLACVQNEFSLAFRSSEDELRHCAARGVAFLPWAPLGGDEGAAALGARHPALARIAAARQVSPQRLCLAWMLRLAPQVIPIVGASTPRTILDSAAAARLDLSDQEVALISADEGGHPPGEHT